MLVLKRLMFPLVALVTLLAVLVLPGCGNYLTRASELASLQASTAQGASIEAKTSQKAATVKEDGTYTSKEDVSSYLHTYGHLPSNYVTKDEAEDAGWKTEGLSLSKACPGKSIGGDRFSNREGRLPKKKGRIWYECDIGYTGGSRGAKRLVYSNDGLIYYTEDHYRTFERLY